MVLERFSGWSRRRKALTLGAAALVAVVVAVVLVWLLVWSGDAPPPPSVLERSEALTATTAVPPAAEPAPTAEPPAAAEPPPAAAPSPPAAEPAEPLAAAPSPPPAPAEPAPPTPMPAEPPAAAPPSPPTEPAAPPAPQSGPYPEPEPPASEPAAPAPPPESPAPAPADTAATEPESAGPVNLDGVWSVDTALGSFEDYSSSWAGYRVGEELSGIGTTEAVGRTPAVSGTLEIAGATVVVAVVDVDLTTLVSDRPQRDGLVQRALDTSQFPSARFELAEPVLFDALPAAGESVTATVAGTFSVHGASRPVVITVEATWIEGVVIVGGIFEIRFEDYGIDPPRAPVVLSVEDTGTVELLLNFTR